MKFNVTFCSVSALWIVLVGNAFLNAQVVTQTLPNPMVINPVSPVFNPAPPLNAMQQSGVIIVPQSLCTCGCGSPTGFCSKDTRCDYQIQGSPENLSHRKVIKTFTIDYPNEGECLDGGAINIPFYDTDIPVDANVSVPRMVKKCIEEYTFKHHSYSLCGCKIDLCLPCEVVCHENKKCEPIEVSAKLLVRVRRELSGGKKVADVWTNGKIQGLPNPAVLGSKMTAAQINSKFRPTPPVSF